MVEFTTKPRLRTTTVLQPRPLIIEFVGPPGAGKTTNCNDFLKLLQAKQFAVVTRHDLKKYIQEMKMPHISWVLAKTLFNHAHAILHFAWVLTLKGSLHYHSVYRYMRILAYQTALLQLIKSRPTDIVLLDQWFIQELWSATIFRKTSPERVRKALSGFYGRSHYLLYFNVDDDTAAERIARRNTRLSRFDSLDAQTRLHALKQYNNYLFQLFEQSDCQRKFVFSALRDPKYNAMQFYALLEQFLDEQQ